MPDRVNLDNVVWFVAEHERRLGLIESHTEDLNVMRDNIVSLRKEVKDLRGDVEALSGLIVKASVSFAFSCLLVAASIFTVLH